MSPFHWVPLQAMSKSNRKKTGTNRQTIVKTPDTSHQPEKDNIEIIWGIHPVSELLKKHPRRISEIIFLKKSSGRLQKIIDAAKAESIKIRFESSFEKVGRLPSYSGQNDFRHQGVMAKVSAYATLSLDELLDSVVDHRDKDGIRPLLLALDSIQDPYNLGAIIRSAVAGGVQGIIIPKDRSAPLSGIVAKSSAGTIANINICKVTNLATALKRLKKEGIWIFGAVGSDDKTIYEADFSLPTCLVVGSEEKGMRPLIRSQCDFLISIPMEGKLDSLNASVATAVVIFEVVRQRMNIS